MSDTNRRKEDRLILPGFSVWLRHKDGAIVCKVLNVSRLGVGIEMPADADLSSLPEIKPETVLKAMLKFEGEKFNLGLRLLRINREQLGCSFEFENQEDQRRLFGTLSPRFAASTMRQAASGILAENIDSAFYGQDFMVVRFKENQRIKVSTMGADCLIEDGEAFVKDHLDADPSFCDEGFVSSFDLIPSIRPSPAEVLKWVQEVLFAWNDCPQNLKTQVSNAVLKREQLNA